MKKLLTIFAVLSFMTLFSSCSEEEIVPSDQLETTGGSHPITGTSEGDWD